MVRVDAVVAGGGEQPGDQLVGLGRVQQGLRHRAEYQPRHEQPDRPTGRLAPLQREGAAAAGR